MKHTPLFVIIFLLMSSCSGHYSHYIENDEPAIDKSMVRKTKNKYSQICGFYSCKELDMLVWLYDDQTFVEKNFWGWFSGCYEADFYYNVNYSGRCAIRMMEKYPPIRNITQKGMRYVYQKNKCTPQCPDNFFVFDRDGSTLQIKHFYYNGMNGDKIKIANVSHDTIPPTATNICVSDAGALCSPEAPYRKGFNIIFFVVPNYNRTNLIWDKKTGLYYESENGKTYHFNKMRLDPILKVSPPIDKEESFQNGDEYNYLLPNTANY